MKSRLGLAALIFGWSVVACSNDSSDSSESNVKKKGADQIEIEASPETKSKLGVEKWGASEDANHTVVHGYDKAGKQIVEVEYTVAYGEGAYHVTTVVSNRTKRSVMTGEVSAAEGKKAAVLRQNQLASDPKARLVLDRIEADAQSGSGSASSSKGGTSLFTKTIDLGSGGSDPTQLIECVTSLIKAVGVVISSVKECVLTEGESGGDAGAGAGAESSTGEGCEASLGKAAAEAGSAASACLGGGEEAGAGGEEGSGEPGGPAAANDQPQGEQPQQGGGGTPSKTEPTNTPTPTPTPPPTPTKTEPTKTPTKTEPTKTEPTKTEPTKTEPPTAPKPDTNTKREMCEATGFTLPFEGTVRVSQGNNGKFSHNTETSRHAFDFDMPRGTSMIAMADGEVVDIKDTTKKGMPCYDGGGVDCVDRANFVRIRHSSGEDSLYLHLDTVSVAKGAKVKRGDVIGTVGSTGQSTGPHAHVQLQKQCEKSICSTVPLTFDGIGAPKSGDEVTTCKK